jgi:hypothetical protein
VRAQPIVVSFSPVAETTAAYHPKQKVQSEVPTICKLGGFYDLGHTLHVKHYNNLMRQLMIEVVTYWLPLFFAFQYFLAVVCYLVRK